MRTTQRKVVRIQLEPGDTNGNLQKELKCWLEDLTPRLVDGAIEFDVPLIDP